jgi:hypothetical protein
MEGPIKHRQFKVEGHDKPGKFMEGGIKCLTSFKGFCHGNKIYLVVLQVLARPSS